MYAHLIIQSVLNLPYYVGVLCIWRWWSLKAPRPLLSADSVLLLSLESAAAVLLYWSPLTVKTARTAVWYDVRRVLIMCLLLNESDELMLSCLTQW